VNINAMNPVRRMKMTMNTALTSPVHVRATVLSIVLVSPFGPENGVRGMFL